MDGGTAYEIGFARALNKPVVGYLPSTYRPEYADRVRHYYGLRADAACDHDRLAIEDFGQVDNLMMATSLSFLGPTIETALDWLKIHLPAPRA
jgi:nucleoside 2-deoxyribosyltransferase